MSNEGLYTSGSTAVSAKVDSIPLRDTGVTQPGQDSIGTLISNATEQVSTLVPVSYTHLTLPTNREV